MMSSINVCTALGAAAVQENNTGESAAREAGQAPARAHAGAAGAHHAVPSVACRRAGCLSLPGCAGRSGRRSRMRGAPGRQGYSLLRGGEEGMSPAELRALPVVIHERRRRVPPRPPPPPPPEAPVRAPRRRARAPRPARLMHFPPPSLNWCDHSQGVGPAQGGSLVTLWGVCRASTSNGRRSGKRAQALAHRAAHAHASRRQDGPAWCSRAAAECGQEPARLPEPCGDTRAAGGGDAGGELLGFRMTWGQAPCQTA